MDSASIGVGGIEENALCSIKMVWQYLREYFDPADMDITTERAARCRKAIAQKDWFGAASFTVRVFLTAAGRGISRAEGCFCRERLIVDARSYKLAAIC